MQSLPIHKINDISYYNSKDMIIYKPEFYIGCKTRPRNIIQKKNISEADHLFANLLNGKWNVSTVNSRKEMQRLVAIKCKK